MTNNQFDTAKSEFELALETLMDACEDSGYDIDDVLSVILSTYDIEL